MSDDRETPEFRAIVQALVDHEQRRTQRRLSQLCERLGIDNSLDENTRWALVGMQLARKEPEFKDARPRGRPRLHGPEDSIDVQRARLVVEGALALAYRPESPRRLTEWIRAWQRVSLKRRRAGVASIPPFNAKRKTLQNSVKLGLDFLDYPKDLFLK